MPLKQTDGLRPVLSIKYGNPKILADQADTSLLETFPNPHPERDYEIETVCPEFTSLCPKTGQPDFGTLTIVYMPAETCFELKSLKLYLQSYRNIGAFYEDVTNRILDDLVALTEPKWMSIEAAFTPRGGIRTTIAVEYFSDELFDEGEMAE